MKKIDFNKDFNIYEEKYDYIFVEAFSIISTEESGLGYEDLFIITQTCYEMWRDQSWRLFKNNEEFSWMGREDNEDLGCFNGFQTYAKRTAQNWIELFKQSDFYY